MSTISIFSQKRRCIIQCALYFTHCIIHLLWTSPVRRRLSHCCFASCVNRLPLVLIFIFNSLFEPILVHRYTGLRPTFNKVKYDSRRCCSNWSYRCRSESLLEYRCHFRHNRLLEEHKESSKKK